MRSAPQAHRCTGRTPRGTADRRDSAWRPAARRTGSDRRAAPTRRRDQRRFLVVHSAFFAQERQLGQGIDVFGRRLAVGDGLELFEELLRIALHVVGQIVDPQQLHGAVAGLRTAARGQLQLLDQRTLGHRTQTDASRGTPAGNARSSIAVAAGAIIVWRWERVIRINGPCRWSSRQVCAVPGIAPATSAARPRIGGVHYSERRAAASMAVSVRPAKRGGT